MSTLKPFWRYYGGKYRAAPRYPAPLHETIIEPFAGAAGYSMRHHTHRVILVERYPVIAEIWRYMITADPSEIRRVPMVEHVDDLPGWVPAGARSLVGFNMNFATATPCRSPGAQTRIHTAKEHSIYRWENMRERIASQVTAIRHWRVIEGEWHDAPSVTATWFVDPPYNNKAGSHYKHGPSGVNFQLLGLACRTAMPGQVIVCENEGAEWLPFRPFATLKAGPRSPGGGSKEVIWTNDP